MEESSLFTCFAYVYLNLFSIWGMKGVVMAKGMIVLHVSHVISFLLPIGEKNKNKIVFFLIGNVIHCGRI